MNKYRSREMISKTEYGLNSSGLVLLNGHLPSEIGSLSYSDKHVFQLTRRLAEAEQGAQGLDKYMASV